MNNPTNDFKTETGTITNYANRLHRKGFSPSYIERNQIGKMEIQILDLPSFQQRLNPDNESLWALGHIWKIDNLDFMKELIWNQTQGTKLWFQLMSGEVRIGMSLRHYRSGIKRVFLKFWL